MKDYSFPVSIADEAGGLVRISIDGNGNYINLEDAGNTGSSRRSRPVVQTHIALGKINILFAQRYLICDFL